MILSASDGQTNSCLIDYPRPDIALALAQLAIIGALYYALKYSLLAGSTTGCDPFRGAALLLGSHVRMLSEMIDAIRPT